MLLPMLLMTLLELCWLDRCCALFRLVVVLIPQRQLQE